MNFIDEHPAWSFVILMVSIAAAMAVLVLLIMWISFHQSAVSCHHFQTITGRHTRWVQYNWFDRDCITPSGHGTWISTSQLRGISGS